MGWWEGEQGAPLPHSLRKGMHHWDGVWLSSPHTQQPGRGQAVVLIPSLNFGGWHLASICPHKGLYGAGV